MKAIFVAALAIGFACAWTTAGAGATQSTDAELIPPPPPGSEPDRLPGLVDGEVKRDPPRFPREDAEAHHAGIAFVMVLIGVDGVAEQVAIDKSTGFAGLDGAALAAASRWRYVPRVQGGCRVRSYARVPVVFNVNVDPSLRPGQMNVNVTSDGAPSAGR